MNEINNDLPKPKCSFYSLVVKRLLDIILSGIALILLSPLLIVACILELHFHGKPIFYKTKRPGKDERIITIRKFRSMTNQRDESGLLLPEKDRLTTLGRFLRRTSIDELPELWSIFKGDMSVIGPRPLLIEYLNLYSPRHRARQSVRPGLACVRIQRSGLSNSWTWRDQFENDIYYIEHISFMTDLKMVCAVVREVLKGAEYRTNDTRAAFDGENLDDIRSKDEVGEQCYFDSLNVGAYKYEVSSDSTTQR